MWRSNQLSYRTVCSAVEKAGTRTQRLRSLRLYQKQDEAQEVSRNGRQKGQPNFHDWHHELRSSKALIKEYHTDVSRKEVFQPHLPVRLPCYDLAPITGFTLGRPSRSRTSGAPGFYGLTGGVYKARERIHRAMADARLLANPASWGRVADPNPNYGAI